MTTTLELVDDPCNPFTEPKGCGIEHAWAGNGWTMCGLYDLGTNTAVWQREFPSKGARPCLRCSDRIAIVDQARRARA